MNHITFTGQGIEFRDYPYKPACVYPNGEILYTETQEINSSSAPPEIWTKGGDILFISAEYKEELRAKAKIHNIPDNHRIDIWALILEPFLDTYFDEADQKRTLKILEEQGIGREEVIRLREELKEVMIAYNFDSMLWDWCHLGLMDVLDARTGKLSGLSFKLSERDFEKFYKEAIALTRKGKVFSIKSE